MIITTELLVNLNACEDEVERFQDHFPNGLELTEVNLHDCLKLFGFDNLVWLFTHLPECDFSCEFKNDDDVILRIENGQLHADSKPAAENSHQILWYKRGKKHRKGGPAHIELTTRRKIAHIGYWRNDEPTWTPWW